MFILGRDKDVNNGGQYFLQVATYIGMHNVYLDKPPYN